MSESLGLRCRCGAVRGVLSEASPRSGIHAVCYCRDCQAFARWLGGEGLLDAAGGSEIFQTAPAQITLQTGQEQLRCVRLSAEGLHRWYVDCCRTPVANTMGDPRVPFAGLLVPFIAADAPARERALGPVKARLFGRDATGPTPPGTPEKMAVTAIPRVLWLLGRGFVRRGAQPSPFFAPGAKLPRVTPQVLTAEERAALGPV
ncbi:hypothetical protein SAMN02745121_03880 [Nannocystis exedens]|uniref:CENP-V/GFA domain-containing protein n=1 Tax=Nannocystis exedens TaxID=54 RepID=A0A1I1ZP12_9BACT|nr:DUF6151 family protein [Nannocystis exedens]PCC75393.1 hypothetical protein NAEX_08503 [Nannocystis exedens]SFE33395.1 hypothetical protein SAMN02745121_03880 [Nannocystis exedens]